MTVRLGGVLSDFVSASAGDDRVHDSVSEYIPILVRRDKERADVEACYRLKAELTHAFAAPKESYQAQTAVDVIARNCG